MTTFAPILLVPWLLVLLTTPLVIRLSRQRGWLDQPDARKQHQQATPIVGGVVVFASLALGLLILSPWMPEIRAGFWGEASLLGLGAGVAAMVVLGLYDDFRNLAPGVKLAAQILIGMGAWKLGFRVEALELPFGWIIASGGIVPFVLTVGWIVLVTNAFNLIDGMDGLAAGISIVVALTVFLLAHGTGATVPVIVALALSGALAGFLRFNLPPARIFLGDAGAMGIGFTTAVLSLASYDRSPAAVALIVPLVIVGLPLIDTMHSALRRAISHVRNPGQRSLSPLEIVRAMVRADRGHVHHLLLRSGLSVQQALIALYTVSAALSVLGLWTRSASSNARWALFLGLLVVGYLSLQLLERRVLRRERALAAAGRTGDEKLADASPRAAG